MKLSLEQIENVAHLARLQLTEAEKEKMREELAPILTYFEILKELDTDQISPTAQVIAVQNLMRPDEVRESASISEVLSNAPMREADFFRIRAVFTEEE
ncbi:MAG: Asp-tRNA(Asn)/Glu-tRNA(Gln) amidotransferase subunit GatC [Chloroflexi bacterium]|uniref:Aspartyl/glutamyl-tRNA(Asn/Gln) amidotransferase subunit C n=1 Tax=Candidatus Chlorohelix allophototropha TaxID=3003348 RepID=A0A8T7M8R4_9CHLR|nr:Asp-tRNA(Asn)/Glu-tRNA(Gln) amidotransferase subunit GatC [Chloroflexota bacterium]WJW68276.1 Asp-tRNA(Asn)/Glu-tRNA(Gln) amidotransferase subunit GatC [Chloroflexota bacterium L227-S17]